MADRSELALLQEILGGSAAQEQTALRDLVFQRLITAGFTVTSAGTVGFTVKPVFDGSLLTNLPNPALLLVTQGGTGLAVYAIGDLIQASATTTLARLAAVATGNALISGGVGVVSAWGKIGLTTHVSGILPTANGGSGIAFFTAAGPTAARVFTFPDASATVLTDNAVVTAAQGGTGIAFFTVAGPASTAKTFTFPNANASVLTDNAVVTVPQGGTGLATLSANGILLGAGTNTPTALAPGTSGNIATSNGTVWQSTAPAAAAAVISAPEYTCFETAGRFTLAVSAGGSNTFNDTNAGVGMNTSATISSGAFVQWSGYLQAQGDGEVGNPTISYGFIVQPVGTDVQIYIGLGNYTASTGTAINFNAKHIGFKITRVASGAINLFATQADGTTEAASAALTTVAALDRMGVYAKITSTGSVAYRWQKNGGAWSSATTLATNFPAGINFEMTALISNNDVATASKVFLSSARYER